MADIGDDSVSEDQWLYGDSNPDQANENNVNGGINDDGSRNLDPFINPDAPSSLDPQPPIPNLPAENENGDKHEGEGGGGNLQIDGGQAIENNALLPSEGGREFDDDDDSDDNDNVNVMIGEIRQVPQYSSLNIKRGGLLTSAGGPPQLKQPGKFSIEEFEQIGTINGVAAHDYNLDSLEDKPWRKPGADITDYFNYGFNEETWRAYCERQKRMRIHESGVGLGPLSNNVVAPMTGVTKVAPPPLPAAQPPRRPTGCIDVIGGQILPTRRTTDSPPKENVIQQISSHQQGQYRHHPGYVMTADRREYSRKGFPDMMAPPPGGVVGQPPPGFPPGMPPPPHMPGGPPGFPGSYGGEFYPEMDQYYAYEPTQDSQWSNTQVLDKVIKQEPLDGETAPKDDERRERDRDRDRERDRDRDRDRHRDRERHRHRSRSRSTERRSRKHKSRSRSPGHRSHKKKKSKKSDRQKEETSD